MDPSLSCSYVDEGTFIDPYDVDTASDGGYFNHYSMIKIKMIVIASKFIKLDIYLEYF